MSGALSIATLAASRLSALAWDGPLPARARPWLTGLAVAVWLPASGLYLALAAVSAWRAARLPATLRYGLGWWSMAFPLGMYAAVTNDLGVNTGNDALVALAAVAFWIALASWLLVAVGLLRQGARWWSSSRRTAPGLGITLPPSPASLPRRRSAAAGRCAPDRPPGRPGDRRRRTAGR